MVGTMMDQKVKYDSLRKLDEATNDPALTVEDVYCLGLQALQHNILFSQKLEVYVWPSQARTGTTSVQPFV